MPNKDDEKDHHHWQQYRHYEGLEIRWSTSTLAMTCHDHPIPWWQFFSSEEQLDHGCFAVLTELLRINDTEDISSLPLGEDQSLRLLQSMIYTQRHHMSANILDFQVFRISNYSIRRLGFMCFGLKDFPWFFHGTGFKISGFRVIGLRATRACGNASVFARPGQKNTVNTCKYRYFCYQRQKTM